MKITKFLNDIGIDNIIPNQLDKYANNFIYKIPFLLINCIVHKDRLEKFDKSAKKIKLKYLRVNCVYGKNYSNKLIYDMFKNNIIKDTNYINQIELSISISHINCWLKILNSKYEYGLVCEDDITFKNDFIKKVNIILKNIFEKNINLDVLYLWNGNWMNTKHKLKSVLKISDNLIIKKENAKFNAGNVCYIISKNMITKLLKKIFPIKNPIDLFMGTFYNKAHMLSLYMKYDKKKFKDISPLFESGTWDDKVFYVDDNEDSDEQSTQNYELPGLKKLILDYKKTI